MKSDSCSKKNRETNERALKIKSYFLTEQKEREREGERERERERERG